MAIPFLDLKNDHEPLRDDLEGAIRRVLQSGNYILGEEVSAFEGEVAEFLGVAHAVGVSSGSDALVTALLAAGVGPGDEVVTTPFSFFATVEAVLRVGAQPRFVDVDADTLMISPEAVRGALRSKTRAILPVHLYGNAAALEALEPIARGADVALVEDAAQAFGAALAGRSLGSWGAFGCFSFFPTKPLGGVGDGGLVVTEDADRAAHLRRLRVHGASARHAHTEWSGNYRLDELQAAVLRVKLTYVERWQKARAERVRRYLERLTKIDAIRTFDARRGERPAHALFTVRVLDGSRDRLRAFLRERGVATAVHYPTPLHAQPALAHWTVDPANFPNTELACRQVLSLPLFPSMTFGQVDAVLEAIEAFYS